MAERNIEKLVLDAAQKDICALSRPFAALGAEFGISEREVLRILKAFKKKGVIRRIGGSFDSGKLGFSSTLAGMRVSPAKLTAVAKEISKLPGVTHCYERDGCMNLWFTLAARGGMRRVNRILGDFRKLPGVEKCYSFPARKIFKLKTFFP